MSALKSGLAALSAVLMAVAVLGIGMGDAPTPEEPAPTGAALQASKERIAQGGEQVAEGREEFEEEGCDSCHAIAADDKKGVLGPRLDTLADDSAEDIGKDITEPRADIVEGYEDELMPADYAKEIEAKKIDALAAYIKAASGDAKSGDGDGG